MSAIFELVRALRAELSKKNERALELKWREEQQRQQEIKDQQEQSTGKSSADRGLVQQLNQMQRLASYGTKLENYRRQSPHVHQFLRLSSQILNHVMVRFRSAQSGYLQIKEGTPKLFAFLSEAQIQELMFGLMELESFKNFENIGSKAQAKQLSEMFIKLVVQILSKSDAKSLSAPHPESSGFVDWIIKQFQDRKEVDFLAFRKELTSLANTVSTTSPSLPAFHMSQAAQRSATGEDAAEEYNTALEEKDGAVAEQKDAVVAAEITVVEETEEVGQNVSSNSVRIASGL